MQGICFLVRYLRCKSLGGREDSRFLVQNNSTPKSFVQGSVFQLDLILNVHKFVFIGIGQQPCKVKRVLVLVEQVFVMEAHKLCNVGICAIELANIIAGGVTVFLSQILIPCNHRAEQTCQLAKRNGILLFITLRCHKLIEGIHIVIVV